MGNIYRIKSMLMCYVLFVGVGFSGGVFATPITQVAGGSVIAQQLSDDLRGTGGYVYAADIVSSSNYTINFSLLNPPVFDHVSIGDAYIEFAYGLVTDTASNVDVDIKLNDVVNSKFVTAETGFVNTGFEVGHIHVASLLNMGSDNALIFSTESPTNLARIGQVQLVYSIVPVQAVGGAPPTSVSAPATLFLMLAGLLGLISLRKAKA